MIKVAIAGLGNCASMLIQGIEFYKKMGKDYTKAHNSSYWRL